MLVHTGDGFTFTVPDAVADRCGTLVGARDADPDPHSIVPVPNVTASTIARIVKFYNGLGELDQRHAGASATQHFVTGFCESMPRRELFDVMEAANYLEATVLMTHTCSYVADMLRNKSPEQIRDFFMLPVDMTDAEARDAARQLAWAFK